MSLNQLIKNTINAKTIMKLFTLVVICLFFILHSFQIQAQLNTTFTDIKTLQPTEWTEHFSNNDFSIEYKFVACDPEMGYDQESILIKFTNKTSNHLSINWHMILHYDSECRTCDYPEESTRNIHLGPNAEKTSDCSVYADNSQLKLFSRFIDENYTKGEVLTGFSFQKLIFTSTTD